MRAVRWRRAQNRLHERAVKCALVQHDAVVDFAGLTSGESHMRTDQLPIHGNPEIMGGTPDFETLAAPDFDPRQVHASVIDFHFRTAGAAQLVCQGRLSIAEWKRDSPHAARSPSGRLIPGRLGGAAVLSGHSGFIAGR